MTLHAGRDIFRQHAVTIVNNTDQRAARLLHLDVDLRCARIEGILGEFFHHRGRTFDDLTRCDLIDQTVRQNANGGRWGVGHRCHVLNCRA